MERALTSTVRKHGVLGDLSEEYADRRASGSRLGADLWYCLQGLQVYWRFKAEARRELHRTFATRGQAGGARGLLDDLGCDLRFFLKNLAKRPILGLSGILTLALGIGSCAAVFTLVSNILVRPLPYTAPERLMTVFERSVESGNRSSFGVSFPVSQYWVENQDVFGSLGVYGDTRRILDYGESVDRLRGAVINAEVLPILGVRPFLGRGFLPEEDVPGEVGVILLSHELWTTRFQQDRDVIGRTITVDEKPFTVVGVMPADFFFPGPDVRFWIPMADAIRNAGTYYLKMVGRLDEGILPETARARARTLQRTRGEGGENSEVFAMGFSPLKEDVVGSDIQGLLGLLAAAVAGVLLIVCTNVASLLVAGAASRRRELTVRAALGAGGWRIARQLLTEATALSLMGAVAGTGVAVVLTGGLLRLSPGLIPRQEEVGIDGGVLVFSLGLALVVGLVVGTVPALKSARTDMLDGLKEGLRGVTGGHRGVRARHVLVVGQVAVAFTLVAAAGLLINSFLRQWTNPSGFGNADRVLAVDLTLPGEGTGRWAGRFATHEQRVEFYTSLTRRLEADPSIRSATLASRIPLGGGGSQSTIEIEGLAPAAPNLNQAGITIIAPEYFSTMGIRVSGGREFDSRDLDPDRPSVIVDQTLVDRYFGGLPPLNRGIRFGEDGAWLTVVGVVAATRQLSLTEELAPHLYLNYAQSEWFWSHSGMKVLVGTRSAPLFAVPAVRSTLAGLDSGVPINSLTSLEDRAWSSVGDARYVALMVGFFGLVALILAFVGVYAVVSHTVTQRTQEIGIRVALGAARWGILRGVLLKGLGLTGMGLAVGAVGSFWAVGGLRSRLFGITPHDLHTFGAAVLVLATSATLASLIPALRATKLDPVKVLGGE